MSLLLNQVKEYKKSFISLFYFLFLKYRNMKAVLSSNFVIKCESQKTKKKGTFSSSLFMEVLRKEYCLFFCFPNQRNTKVLFLLF